MVAASSRVARLEDTKKPYVDRTPVVQFRLTLFTGRQLARVPLKAVEYVSPLNGLIAFNDEIGARTLSGFPRQAALHVVESTQFLITAAPS